MPRLLRIHFASIGHKDARLSPLTLDLRDATGAASDSVLWLRNGGGKSSIINLFFSIFRTRRREFLGAAAEGKARKIEHYVKAKDLALAVTEWDLGEDADGQARHCIVGRVLAWKGQTISADPSNLRRLFFSFMLDPAHDAALGLEVLPLAGLGEPVSSFEAFRDWLRQRAEQHPASQVVHTDNNRKWADHLERLGLDPELFRYQIRMNLREGAADEVFRFGTAIEFVNFLLELAFDAQHANRVAQNLEELRDQIARRPARELERSFIVEALAALHPLVAAVGELARSRGLRNECLLELSGLARALRERAERLGREASVASERAQESEDRARLASNERDKRSRWARGLEHLGSELEVAERQARCAELGEARREVQDELHVLEAATVRRKLARLEAELVELHESLCRAQEALAPERDRLERAGSSLLHALSLETERLDALLEDIMGRLGVAEKTCATKQERIDALRTEQARLEERIRGLKAVLRRRDAAREKLQKTGWIELREGVMVARARWDEAIAEGQEKSAQLEASRLQCLQQIEEGRDRQRVLTGELASSEALRDSSSAELTEALRWRQALAENACIVELEAVDDPDLRSAELELRLRRVARGAAVEILESRVDGAEDERALGGLESGGLLPPSRDVERVVESLRHSSINAHAGTAFLAENEANGARLAKLLRSPARFGGVLVVADTLSDKVAEATRGLDLRSAVQISAVGCGDLRTAEQGVVVVPPNPASYDHAHAESLRATLQERREARERRVVLLEERRRDYERAADELARYLDAHGGGRLDALQQRFVAAEEEVARAQDELLSLSKLHQASKERLSRIDDHRDETTKAQHRAEQAAAALQSFWDEHESRIDSTRVELESSEKRSREAARELSGHAIDELRCARARLETLKDESKDRQRDHIEIVREAGGVEYQSAQDSVDQLALDSARDRYENLLADWQQRNSDQRLQWKIEEASKQAKPLRDELAEVGRDVDMDAVESLATEPDLKERIARAESHSDVLREQFADAAATAKLAEERLADSARRRDARDLPPETEERPSPTTAVAARSAADEMRIALQEFAESAREAEESNLGLRADATRLDQAQERYSACAAHVDTLAEGAQLALPSVKVSAALPEHFEAVEVALDEARVRFKVAREQVQEAESCLQAHAAQVRAIASAQRFIELKSQARELMNAEVDELCEDAERIATKLAPRLEVIDRQLAEIEQHRRTLVGALQGIGSKAGTLLQRAQRSSIMPSTLGAWAGKPYLRLRFQFPETEEEQRSKLAPLVDRLVQKAQIPDGLTLVKLAVAALAGERGFEAKILKPDAVLRPDPISIAAMNTFSRGQQLTAAILLYCTLVQLRARSRGRANDVADAGILLLDNPIGTCSSVPLLELQRTIAREMRVQLIYATGVDDLEALDTLPNKVRLRNTMRDRSTGDFHVTHEAHVEAVRIINNERS